MEIKEILDYLNKNYGQDSENYSIAFGARPGVIRLDEHTAISFWSCGAIVCTYSSLSFISEDDGNWFLHKNFDGAYEIEKKFVKYPDEPQEKMDMDSKEYKEYMRKWEDAAYTKKFIRDACSEPVLSGFSIAWAKGFADALNALVEYVNTHGTPVYFSGLSEKIVCHYTL